MDTASCGANVAGAAVAVVARRPCRDACAVGANALGRAHGIGLARREVRLFHRDAAAHGARPFGARACFADDPVAVCRGGACWQRDIAATRRIGGSVERVRGAGVPRQIDFCRAHAGEAAARRTIAVGEADRGCRRHGAATHSREQPEQSKKCGRHSLATARSRASCGRHRVAKPQGAPQGAGGAYAARGRGATGTAHFAPAGCSVAFFGDAVDAKPPAALGTGGAATNEAAR